MCLTKFFFFFCKSNCKNVLVDFSRKESSSRTLPWHQTKKRDFFNSNKQSRRQSSRLRRAKCLSGGPKFEIKHKSRCLQKSKLVDCGNQACRWGAGPPWPPLAPVLATRLMDTVYSFHSANSLTLKF